MQSRWPATLITGTTCARNWKRYFPLIPFKPESVTFPNFSRWAFDGGNLSAIGVKTWRFYKDDELVNQILKARYLHAYPVLGRFVSNALARARTRRRVGCQDYRALPCSRASWRTGSLYCQAQIVHAGHGIHPQGRQTVRGKRNPIAKNGFLDTVCITTWPRNRRRLQLQKSLSNRSGVILAVNVLKKCVLPFQTLLQLMPSPRYAKVDNLEQVTTRFSFEELLERQVKLGS